MRCDEMAAGLTDLLEGELPREVEQEALEHPATCPNCEQVFLETHGLLELARTAGREQLPAARRQRLLDSILEQVESSESR